MLAALVRRPDETLQQLLERLNRAVQLALDDEIYTAFPGKSASRFVQSNPTHRRGNTGLFDVVESELWFQLNWGSKAASGCQSAHTVVSGSVA